MTTEIDEKIADYRLVMLDGYCFYQHRKHKNVLMCKYCAEDGKQHHLAYDVPNDDAKHKLKCHCCGSKADIYLSHDPSKAHLVDYRGP